MKRNLFFGVLLSCVTVLWGCKEQSEDELTLKDTTLDNVTMALPTPTSTSKGMKNYESYYRSAVDGLIHGYIISIPLTYDPAKSDGYPLLIFYHGNGERPTTTDYDIKKIRKMGPNLQTFTRGRAFPAIIVTIQMAKTEWEFNPKVTKEFIDILTGQITSPSTVGGIGLTSYNINLNRIHLTGLSLGGYATYKTAFTYPDLFASISVFSGYTDSREKMSLIKMPVYIRHNERDPIVVVGNAYNAQKWINAVYPIRPVNLKVFNSASHNAWDPEYARIDDSSVFEWHWRQYKGRVAGEPTTQPKPSTAPTITSFSPAKNATVTATTSATLTLTFSSDVKKGTGSFTIKNLTSKGVNVLDVNSSSIKISGNKVTISPVKQYDKSVYAYQISAGAFTDLNGNAFAGISDDNTWTYSVGTTNILSISSFTPSINANVKTTTNATLSLVFNSNVKKGKGTFLIKNLTLNSSKTIDVSSSTIKITGNRVDIAAVKQNDNCIYAYQISRGAFTDLEGKEFTGIADDNTWTYTVGNVIASAK